MDSTDWKDKIVSLILLEFLRIKGFSRIEKCAFEILKDVVLQYLKKIMLQTKNYAEMDMRSEVCFLDVVKITRINGPSLPELQTFLTQNSERISSGAEFVASEFIRNRKGIFA